MLKHDFLLLREQADSYSDYMRHINSPAAITIHDDLIVYMLDTLNWIPTINPANPTEWIGHGLNYYGPTVINTAGAEKAASIFRRWADLFREGPKEITLTGGYEWIEGESASEGNYAMISVARDSAVKNLQTIADFADQAATGQFFVLHNGI